MVIGRSLGSLEDFQNKFVVEALADTVRPEWIDGALSAHERHSQRRRRLPAQVVVWFVVMLGLHRRTSYENLLEKVQGGGWAQSHWSSPT